MAGKLRYIVFLLAFFPITLGLVAARANAMPANTVDLISPAACPSSGCAAGQRLNMRADFNVSVFDSAPSSSPNVQVCIYTPFNWSVNITQDIAARGGITNVEYNHQDTSHCETAPANYTMIGGASAFLPGTAFGDALDYAFRLGAPATTSGSVLVRVLERDSTGSWQRTGQTFSAIPVTATATVVYVANDAAACLTNSPCYVNSGDDEPLGGGIGTGFKDAVDVSATPITINILGNYLIKDNTVIINMPHTITGVNNSSISYQGTNCTLPMIKISGGATLSNLAINSGACSSPLRTLVEVESPSPVTIDSNTLTHGLNAIHVTAGNATSVGIHFNDIQNNSGYGILADTSNIGTDTLDAVANNIFGNRSGAQAECNGATRGTVDHNYWGAAATNTAISQCKFADAKRLGAPIQLNTNAPGVNSQRVTATTTLGRAFNGLIGFQMTGPDTSTTTSLALYIVNHGANVPFTAANPQPMACSNYWDVFRADNIYLDPLAILSLHFKYTLSQSCINNVNLTQYCGQTTNPSKYPLYWFESDVNAWAVTGQNPGGQPTVCDTTQDEIAVSIKTNSAGNRPDFSDLGRVPFVVSLPSEGMVPILTSFTAQPGSQLVILNWATSSPVSGFYVQRSTLPDRSFVRVSDLLASATTTYTDAQNVVNYTTYYYRLEIVNPDLSTSLTTQTVSVTPIPPTATPTPTATMTRTATHLPTYTPTRTQYPTTIYYYKSPTPTRSITPTPTSPFQTVTPTLPPTSTPSATQILETATSTQAGYPVMTATIDAGTEIANARATRTAIVKLSQTPTPRPASKTPPLSLTAVLAILAGIAAVGGIAIFLLRDRIKLPF
jgi:hypothetical protein